MNFQFEKTVIYLITPGEATDANFDDSSRHILTAIQHAVDEKVSLIQIREKDLSAKLLYELTTAAVQITSRTKTRLLVNDRADIAVAAKADGVHLTANSVPVRVVRNLFPKKLIVGVSTHTEEDVFTAKDDGADFAVFGPIFSTPGKGEPTGLDVLSQICHVASPFPVIGLGGIDAENCESAVSSGAAGIAAIRSLNDAKTLRSIVNRLR
ncbi:thiamine phosphate synthase [soil metagenome]